MFAHKLALIATLLLSVLALPAQAQSFNGRFDRAADTRLARVIQVSPVEIERRGMNTGTIVGVLLGGLAGKQVGHGATRDVATGVGALLGGHAGTRVQRRARSNIAYEIVYQELDGRRGRLQTIIQSQALTQSGDLVFVSGRGRDASLTPVSPEARSILEAESVSSSSVDDSAHRRAARQAVDRAVAEGLPSLRRLSANRNDAPDTIDGLPVYRGAGY